MSNLLPLTQQLYQYILSNSVNEPEPLYQLRKRTQTFPEGRMMTLPDQAQFISFLLKLIQANKVIEIGVFTGYSTAWMALAVPATGKVIACDINKKWIDIGKSYWKELNIDTKIEILIGNAADTLSNLIVNERENSFDAVFIDANKSQYDEYYEKSLVLIKPGGLIIFDNLLWSGKVTDYKSIDSTTISIQRLTKKLQNDHRIHFSLLSIADGIGLVLKK